MSTCPETEDRYWLLAIAVLDTIAEDLAICRAAGWWQDSPAEMSGRCREADVLLRELTGSTVQFFADIVCGETNRRIDIDSGWVIRRARDKSEHGLKSGTMKRGDVASAIRLPNIERFTPNAARPWLQGYRDLKAAHHCTRCGTALDPATDRHRAGHFYSSCRECRLHHTEQVKAAARGQRLPAPQGSVPWSEWARQICTHLGISRQTLMRRMASGKIPTPHIVKHSQRTWYVIPERRTAA